MLTIFPEIFTPFWEHGIIKRAISRHQIEVATINIRDFATGKHRATDDRPYGGGCGMVMKPEPLADAIRAAKKDTPGAHTILLTPQGRTFNQTMARQLATLEGLIFVSGRYEGIDERICDTFIDYEVSIGDFVLTGGELAAMIIIDAVTRLIPNVLGGEDSAAKDSFADGFLKHAQFTRPHEFEGCKVPAVLTSGNHGAIDHWRLETSLMHTLLKRKDLFDKKTLSSEEIAILKQWYRAIEQIIQAQSLRSADPLPCRQ